MRINSVAIEVGRQALALDARLPEAYLHLGNALLALMEVPQAEACYRDGLAQSPDHRALLTAQAMALISARCACRKMK